MTMTADRRAAQQYTSRQSKSRAAHVVMRSHALTGKTWLMVLSILGWAIIVVAGVGVVTGHYWMTTIALIMTGIMLSRSFKAGPPSTTV